MKIFDLPFFFFQIETKHLCIGFFDFRLYSSPFVYQQQEDCSFFPHRSLLMSTATFSSGLSSALGDVSSSLGFQHCSFIIRTYFLPFSSNPFHSIPPHQLIAHQNWIVYTNSLLATLNIRYMMKMPGINTSENHTMSLGDLPKVASTSTMVIDHSLQHPP